MTPIAMVFFASLFFPAAPEPEGLVGHWKLQGDCKDDSGKGNHGTGRNLTFGEGVDGSAGGAAVLNRA